MTYLVFQSLIPNLFILYFTTCIRIKRTPMCIINYTEYCITKKTIYDENKNEIALCDGWLSYEFKIK